MASFADLQAQALARSTQTPTANTPEVDMDNAEIQLEVQENTPDNSDPDNDTSTAPRGGLNADELTQLVWRYNLPERTLADAATFQQVLPSICLSHMTKLDISFNQQLHPSVQQVLIYLSLQEIRSFISTLPRPEEWWHVTLLFEVCPNTSGFGSPLC